MLKEYYVTGDDENICRRDIPERQADNTESEKEEGPVRKDLAAESRWVAHKMKKSSEEEVEAVKRCLVFFNETPNRPTWLR